MILIPLLFPHILQVRNYKWLSGQGHFVLPLFSDVPLAGHCPKDVWISALTHHGYSHVLLYYNKFLILNNKTASAGREPVKYLEVQCLTPSPVIQETFSEQATCQVEEGFRHGYLLAKAGILWMG